MPGVKLCGSKLLVATDDFSLVGFCILPIYIFWIVAASLVVAQLSHFDCRFGWLFNSFAYGFLAASSLSFILEVWIVVLSFRGDIIRGEKRELISPLLYIQLIFIFVELVFMVFGSIVGIGDYECSSSKDYIKDLFRALVFVTWGVYGIRFFVYLAVFLSAFKKPEGDKHPNHNWQEFLRKYCFRMACVDSSEHIAVLEELAEHFKTLFKGDRVVTDVMAGLTLVHRLQQHLRSLRKASPSWDPRENRPSLLDNQADRAVFREIQHFAPYALGAYGWMLVAYQQAVKGCCRLLGQMCTLCCPSSDSPPHHGARNVQNDNCCKCYTAGFLTQLGHRHQHILHANIANHVQFSPYFIIADTEKKTIVITVRGTLSTRDLLTDGCATPVDFDLPGFGPTLAHRGILLTAQRILEDIETTNLLSTMFEPSSPYHGYSFIVTGHSLGAGVAVLLSCLLHTRFPDLRCLAYSTPPVLGEEACTYVEQFVYSIILGSDMVARLSMESLVDIQKGVDIALRCNTENKFSIFTRKSARHLWWESEHFEPVPPPTKRSLAVAGRIVHLVKVGKEPKCCHRYRRVFEPVWGRREDFYELRIDGRMINEHFPDLVIKELQLVDASSPNNDQHNVSQFFINMNGASSDQLIGEEDKHVVALEPAKTDEPVTRDEPGYIHITGDIAGQTVC